MIHLRFLLKSVIILSSKLEKNSLLYILLIDIML